MIDTLRVCICCGGLVARIVVVPLWDVVMVSILSIRSWLCFRGYGNGYGIRQVVSRTND